MNGQPKKRRNCIREIARFPCSFLSASLVVWELGRCGATADTAAQFNELVSIENSIRRTGPFA